MREGLRKYSRIVLAALTASSCLVSAQTAPNGHWQPIGPAGATVEAITFDPADSRHILAGTYFGGIYESLNSGGDWVHIDSPFSTYTVFSLTFDRNSPGVVYAGTFAAGLFKSLDSGHTWTEHDNGITDPNIQMLVVDPSDSHIVLAASPTALFRTTDAGDSWTAVTGGLEGVRGSAALFDPRTPGVVYFATSGAGVFRSVDHGLTWSAFSDGMGGRNIVSVTAGNGVNGRVYASASDGSAFKLLPAATSWTQFSVWPGSPLGSVNQIFPHPSSFKALMAATSVGIWISRNDGDSWTPAASTPTFLIASDTFATIVMAAGLRGGLSSTEDFGKTWTNKVNGLQNVFVGSLLSTAHTGATRAFAATEYGVFENTSAGWSPPSLGKRVFTVNSIPGTGGTGVFAGTESAGVWRTLDSGQNWTPSYNGIYPGKVYALRASRTAPGVVYAGTSAGLFISADSGASWVPSTATTIPSVFSVAVDPGNSLTAYFSTLDGQIYKTLNAGASISQVFAGQPGEIILDLKVSPLFSNRVYAVSSSGSLYITDDGGASWSLAGPPEAHLLSIDINPKEPWKIYAGSVAGGVYKSITGGIDWTQADMGRGGVTVYSVVVDTNNPAAVYASSDGHVYVSTDEGLTWADVSTGLPSGVVNQVVVQPGDSTQLYAAVQDQGVYRRTDSGGAWEAVNMGLPSAGAWVMAVDPLQPGRLISGTTRRGMFLSLDRGTTWASSSLGMTLFVRGLGFDSADSSTVYAGTLLGGVFKSTDQGANWTNIGLQNKTILQIQTDPVRSGVVYVGAADGISRSGDGGITWSDLGQQITFVFSMWVDPGNRDILYIGGSGGSIYRSENAGKTWIKRNNGIPASNVLSLIADSNGTLYAGLDAGPSATPIYKSADGGQSWQATGMPPGYGQLVGRLSWDTGARALYAATNGKGVLVSLDGKSWGAFNTGLTSLLVNSVVGSPTRPGTIYAATSDAGIFKSVKGQAFKAISTGLKSLNVLLLLADSQTDGLLWAAASDGLYRTSDSGAHWTISSDGLPDEPIADLAMDPGNHQVLYAVTLSHGVYKSSDGGHSWTNSGLSDGQVQCLGVGSNAAVYAGSLGSGFIVSQDAGQSWSAVASPETFKPFVLSLAIDPQTPSTVYAGTNAGLLKSTDDGGTWSALQIGSASSNVLALATDAAAPGTIYAGTSDGVYVSANGGTTWTFLSDGMFHRNVTSLAIDSVDHRVVYAGTEGGGVFRYGPP